MRNPIQTEKVSRTGRGGFALVLVLSALVLLTALVLAFFISVTTESLNSKSYGVSEQSRKLADEALNIVTSQISDATTEAANNNEAWISQPGLIRCFDTSGNLVSAYKLFSSPVMRDTNSTYDPGSASYAQSDIPPANWYFSPARYTDLNAPVYLGDSSGTVIINSQKYTPVYPIVDPTAAYVAGTNPNGVHGFSVSSAPVNNSVSVNNPLPMPTQWFYVLQDGTIASASGTGNTVTLTGATTTNPIVGRVAFWTDDDTCKVNINTAAGDLWTPDQIPSTTFNSPGSFADMPHFYLNFESLLAFNQPVNHEFQRYPGHPATTYLSAVFPFLTRSDIAAIAPRTALGGSLGGTVNTLASNSSLTTPSARLFASTDELNYSLTYPVPSSSTPASRMLVDSLTTVPSPTNISQLTPSIVARANFFITAHSRAPETNLFNRPRVTVWPEAATAAQSDGTTTILGARTAFDSTIAFCSTVGGQPFYFVRNNSSSSTEDWKHYPSNQTLYQYLQYLTGDGTVGTSGFDGSNIPGFGGNFKSKYGNDRDQILTEIFDYIRCTNLCDSTLPAPTAANGISNRYTVGPQTSTPIQNCPSGTGQVIPIEITSPIGNNLTRGMGRCSTLYSPTLMIYATSLVANNQNGDRSKDAKVTGANSVFLMEWFDPAEGVLRVKPNLSVQVDGLDSLQLDGNPMKFPATETIAYNSLSQKDDHGWGGLEGACNLFGTGPMTLGTSANGGYPFYSNYNTSNQIPIASKEVGAQNAGPLTAPTPPTSPTTINLTSTPSSSITVQVFAVDPNGNKSAYIQKFTLTFPDLINTLSTPRFYGDAFGNMNYWDLNPANYPSTYDWNSNTAGRAYSTANILNWQDVTRALEPTCGDMRIYQGMKDVPASAFTTDVKYFTSKQWAHSLRAGGSQAQRQDTANVAGKLIQGAAYYNDILSNLFPVAPPGLNGAFLTGSDGNPYPGDWDTGMFATIDGPYINKPDEGELSLDPTYPPYAAYSGQPVQGSLFSPNRQIPSAVMFGSLPTGVKKSQTAFINDAGNPSQLAKDLRPWQTLLFNPNPASDCNNVYGKIHPGFQNPPDYLLLDLFTMPVVEPYPISEPFSTAGKINMNYQIVPFNYITRNTGLQAVLKSTRITAVPSIPDASINYKNATSPATTNYRLEIDPDQTLVAFNNRFTNNKPFISASEICTMFLVPQGQTYTDDKTMATWWSNYALTGDNLREKPYADLYGRLTTKSNTFTVHIRAQSLLKVKGSNATQWTEGADVVTGEYRGSYTLERYLDPNLTTYNTSQPLTAYKFRVVETKQFAP